MRCVIYCRVSTDGQKDNYSLPDQERMCRERAGERGYEIVQVVREEFSGAKVDRPGMNEVLELAHDSAFDILLISDLDRFARDPVPKILLKRELEDCGIRIEYVLKDFTPDATGELMEDILTAFASHERKTIISRMKRGRKSRAQAGYIVGTNNAKYGYDYISEEHKGWYTINPTESEVVKYIFDLFIKEGLGQTAIARRLSDEGYRTRNGKKWNVSTIHYILSSEVYIGRWHYGKYDHSGGSKRPRRSEDWIEVEVPAIIDEDVWDEAQRLRKQRQATKKRNQKNDYLLTGRMKCAVCGTAFVGNAQKPKKTMADGTKKAYKYLSYRCYNATTRSNILGTKICKGSISAKTTESLVWDYVYSMISNPQNMAEAVSKHNSDRDTELGKVRSRLGVLESEVAKIETQRERLLDLLVDSDEITTAALKQRLKTLGESQKALMDEQKRLSSELERKPQPVDLAVLTQFCEAILQHELSFAGKRRILEILDIQVVVNKPEKWLLITGSLPEKLMSLDHATSNTRIYLIKFIDY